MDYTFIMFPIIGLHLHIVCYYWTTPSFCFLSKDKVITSISQDYQTESSPHQGQDYTTEVTLALDPLIIKNKSTSHKIPTKLTIQKIRKLSLEYRLEHWITNFKIVNKKLNRAKSYHILCLTQPYLLLSYLLFYPNFI